jgi:hypothetical protein
MGKNIIVILIMFGLILYGSFILSLDKITVMHEIVAILLLSKALDCFLFLCNTVKE